jgi:uncharacterized membrane protein
MSTGRLESFSDGVIAVAITLLVLFITVPDPAHTHHLGRALGNEWPEYAAYVTSFITIGIIWINHHVMVSRLAYADHSILMLNLVLLLTIAVIPFGTNLMATYLKQGHGDKLAAGIYAGIFLAMGLAFAALQRQIMLHRSHMLKMPLSLEQRRKILARMRTGLPPYAIATGIAAVSAYASVAICAALAVFYALPIASSADV